MNKACSLPLRSSQARGGGRGLKIQLTACSERDIEKLSGHLLQGQKRLSGERVTDLNLKGLVEESSKWMLRSR